MKTLQFLLIAGLATTGCDTKSSAEQKDQEAVNRQQEQYGKAQPVPHYDYSLERDVAVQLYNARNQRVGTFTVWRSDTGIIEGHCPSIGYPLPYDTSLTNPNAPYIMNWSGSRHVAGIVGQAEPNGLFASQNSTATWVRCITKVNDEAVEAPVYVESKVTAYPFPVDVDYEKNTVKPVSNAKPSVTIKAKAE